MTYVDDYVKRLQQIQALNHMSVAQSMLPEPASKSELANLILQKARSDFSVPSPSIEPAKKEKKGGIKSLALGLIDKLARPGYALNEAMDVAFNEPGAGITDVLQGAKRGITGEDQTSYVDVLQHQDVNAIEDDPEYQKVLQEYGPNEAAFVKETKEREANRSLKNIVGGTLVDIVLDPINAVPGGAIVGGIGKLNK